MKTTGEAKAELVLFAGTIGMMFVALMPLF
jgi:hypothetical protein